MSQAPLPVNAAAQLLGGFIQKLMSGGEVAAEAFLTEEFPFLADPILQSILDFVVEDLGQAIQTAMINTTTSIVINIQTSAEKDSLINAATALQIAQASGNEDAIKSALSKAKEAYASLFHWDGTFSAP